MVDSLGSLLQLLSAKRRPDLVDLLSEATLSFDVSSQYGSHLFSQLTTAEFYSPLEVCERLRSLPQPDRELILDMLREIHPPRAHDMEIVSVEFLLDPDRPTVASSANDDLLADIEAQRNLMIAVSTDGPRIKAVDPEYKERRRRIQRALADKGLKDPNPHADLWAWYGKWSSGDLPTYRSRRQYVSELYEPLVAAIESGAASLRDPGEGPTGWPRVDRGLDEMRVRLQQACNEEQFQAVGLLCREVLISTAQAVYDPEAHPPLDAVTPSATDAKRMLESYLEAELAGSGNKEARKHARAALDLANKLQHDRTADFRSAALCAEATTSVANIVATISGRRDPE